MKQQTAKQQTADIANRMTGKKEQLAQDFCRIFSVRDTGDLRFFFAPGRINLMGDHIDYCGGMVLPAAIRQGTYFAIRANHTDRMRIHSINFGETREFSLKNIQYNAADGWLNYPKGILSEYHKLSLRIPGADILCVGDLPIGSALSSSASFLVGTAIATLSLIPPPKSPKEIDGSSETLLSPAEIALLCQRAESDFNGLQCGIMDQATIMMGRVGKVLHLNCTNLECEYVTPNTGDCVFLIPDSGKPRSLKDSKYNERKAQADAVLNILQTNRPGLNHLCEITKEAQDDALQCIEESATETKWSKSVLKRRARHIISENLRVRDFRDALVTGDTAQIGKILTESHISLDKDYEVSGEILNILAYDSLKHPGVLGARMTGAGFSGCALCLVEKNALEDYRNYIAGVYKKKTGTDVSCFVAEFSDGARELL